MLPFAERACRKLAGIAVAAALIGAPAEAAPFGAAYFFGDSMTDTGNAGNLPPAVVLPDGTVVALPPSTPPDPADGYFTTPFFGLTLGRFSNGPVWPEYLAGRLGLGATAAVAGGTNFAVGGALSSQLALEIFAFHAFVPAGDPDALYSVLIGANDIIDIVRGSLVLPIEDAVANVLAGILALQSLGAQHFLVPTLPDVGLFTQFTPVEAAAATALTQQFNALLLGGIDALGIDAVSPDLFTLTREMVADPAAFGLVEIATPCLLDAACRADPQGPVADGFLLFDDRHGTTAVHALVAGRAAEALIAMPEPPIQAIFVMALALGIYLRRRH